MHVKVVQRIIQESGIIHTEQNLSIPRSIVSLLNSKLTLCIPTKDNIAMDCVIWNSTEISCDRLVASKNHLHHFGLFNNQISITRISQNNQERGKILSAVIPNLDISMNTFTGSLKSA